MDISIIIPTYHKKELLLLVLKSLCVLLNEKFSFEVIICNDDLDKNDLSDIERDIYPYPLMLLNFPHAGRAAARNQGIINSTGKLVFFNDDDTLLTKDCLFHHWNSYLANENEIKIGQRNQLYLNASMKKELSQCEIMEFGKKLSVYVHNAQPDIYSKQTRRLLFRNDTSNHWLTCTTANMSISRSLLNKYGLFDEKFEGWGFEDTELGYRLVANGIQIRLLKSAVNYHMEHTRDRIQLVEDAKKNIKYFMYKYNDAKEITLYYKFFMGEISINEFDAATYKEILDNEEEVFFQLFNRR